MRYRLSFHTCFPKCNPLWGHTSPELMSPELMCVFENQQADRASGVLTRPHLSLLTCF